MAKIIDYQGHTDQYCVFEDPRVSSTDFFLFDNQHDFSTLSPIYNKKYSVATSRANGIVSSNGMGVRYSTSFTNGAYQMSLMKPWTEFFQYTTITVSYNNQATRRFNISMDPNVPGKAGAFVLNNGNTDAIFHFTGPNGQSTSLTIHSYDIDASTPINDIPFRGGITSTSHANHMNPRAFAFALDYYQPTSKILYTHMYYQTSGQWYTYYLGVASVSWPKVTSATQTISFGSYVEISYMGFSDVDGLPLFFETTWNTGNSAYARVAKFTTSALNSKTTLIQTATPSSGAAWQTGGVDDQGLASDGTMVSNDGTGYRYGSSSQNTRDRAGKMFTDPRDLSGNTMLWYSNFVDDESNFHPILWTWDKSTDDFTYRTDVQMNPHAGASPGFTGKSSEIDAWNQTDLLTGHGAYMFNPGSNVDPMGSVLLHMFEFAGERYLTHIWQDEARAYTSTTFMRTMLTWKIDAVNPRIFTFHSRHILNVPFQEYIFLNDEESLIGLKDYYSFQILAFNSATGWEEANSLPYDIGSMGRDSTDRIWFIKSSTSLGSTSYPEVHLLTPTLPLTVTVTPAQTSYTYAGSQIASTVDVSAYNATGDRISTDVKLLIEGTGMTFTGGVTVVTVTTSAIAELPVDIFINSAGFSNITASVDV